jgi:hypothetical protein
MRMLTIYITSQLSSVPVLDFIAAPDDEEARKLAAARLFDSRDYVAVEVRDGDEFLFAMKRQRFDERFDA